LRDGLAVVRGERRDVDERLHLVAPRGGDHGAGIGVTGEHDRALRPLKRAIERRDVVLK
jgi:hypothetical protein